MTDLSLYNNETNVLLKNAQYLWHEPEHKDWGERLDNIPGAHLNKLCSD